MTEKMQVKMKADVDLVAREVPSQRIIEIEITAPQVVVAQKRFPLNLGLVLDRSGSMGGAKIEQAKQTLKRIIEQMAEGDEVSVVAFDDTIRTVASGIAINPGSRQELMHDIDLIHSGGSTNLTDGWLTGCNCVAQGPVSNYVRRTLLVSDGLANAGITNHEEIFSHAAALFKRGITTSTFGVGEGFDEHLLEGMANRGCGNFAYIESAAAIDQVIQQEFKDLVTVTAHNVQVEITLPPGTDATLPGEWKMEKKDRKLIVSLSDLPANRVTTLFLNLLTPPGEGQLVLSTVVTYENENGKKRNALGELTLQYATQQKVAAAKQDDDLMRRYSAVEAGQRMNEALKLERAGRRDEAQHLMRQMLAQYGQNMPAPTRERYSEIADRIDRGLQERERKNLNMDSYLLKKHRHPDEH
jgi:Ca-activated chloride channel family protein